VEIGYAFYDSPIGRIYVVVSEKGVCKVELFTDVWDEYIKSNGHIVENETLCRGVLTQLDEYFKGKRKVFDLPLDIKTTEFRQKVWNALRDIPYGKTKSYQEIAIAIGNPKAIRAVGQANKANQLPLIIPCQRVIGKNGKLVGFAGDKTPTQKWLLQHEGYEIYD